MNSETLVIRSNLRKTNLKDLARNKPRENASDSLTAATIKIFIEDRLREAHITTRHQIVIHFCSSGLYYMQFE